MRTRIYVSFNVYSDKLKAIDITNIMGLEADQSIDKGELISGSAQKAKRTRWTIKELGYDLNTVEDIVSKIMYRLTNISENLHLLSNDSELILSICMSWYSGDPSPGVRLDVKNLEILYQNNIAVEFITELYPTQEK